MSLRASLGYLRRQAASVFKLGRRVVHRRLHPGRHRRVLARLRALDRPRHVIVVCHGNICRSPYFEAVLRRLLTGVEVSSAGFVGPGRSVPEHSTTVATRRGVDLSSHRSRLVTEDILRRADLVLVMDADQARRLTQRFRVPPARVIIAGDLDPEAGDARVIRDPWRQPIEVFESSFTRIDRCAAVFAAAVDKLGETSR